MNTLQCADRIECFPAQASSIFTAIKSLLQVVDDQLPTDSDTSRITAILRGAYHLCETGIELSSEVFEF